MLNNKLINNLFMATLGILAWVAPASYGDVLQPGQYDYFSFSVSAGQDYQISYDYQPQYCTSSTDAGSCCALLINYSAAKPSLVSAEEMLAARLTRNPVIFFHAKQNQSIAMAIYGLSECHYSAPVVTPLTHSQMLQRTGVRSQNGQLLNLTVTASTEFTPRYYLRDTSWRAQAQGGNNPHQGQMAADAAIETRAYTGFTGDNNDYSLFTELKPLDSFNPTPDQAELADAQYNSSRVYQYLLNHLGINSFDNRGASMYALVNEPAPLQGFSACGKYYPPNSMFNAFWDGVAINFTPKVNVDDEYPDKSFTAALDVIAHEWGHAVSENWANLNYERESGALNEAYSDWLGIAVKMANGDNSWIIGSPTLEVRSLENPPLFRQPDTYLEGFWKPTSTQACPQPDFCNDDCGVHTNSGVPNKMFYLLAQGGNFNNVQVGGLGIETAIKIATDAMRNYWHAKETFLTARAGMEAAAAAYGSNAVDQVRLAWRAVGVRNDADNTSPPVITPPVVPPVVTPTPTTNNEKIKSSTKSGGAINHCHLMWLMGVFLVVGRVNKSRLK